GLKNFVTLSPFPGFARWLAKARASPPARLLSEAARETLMLLDDPHWRDNDKTAAEGERVLLPLATRYCLVERTSEGRPVDHVARFHLCNG
ncbi:malonyl-CoA decarboxylase domain-containing protein, partial [Rhizobium ruizarguesonis]